MDPAANAAPATPRAKPSKMRAFICAPVCTDCTTTGLPEIKVLAEAKSVSDKDIKAEVKKLGYGKYSILTCRFDAIELKEVKRDSFA